MTTYGNKAHCSLSFLDGVLEVGKEGQDLAFISWKDHEPLPVTTIGFSTWPGVEAKWYFDCITDDIKVRFKSF